MRATTGKSSDSPDPSTAELMRVRAALLRWFDAHARDLPWRAPRGELADPYRVWVSEIMLQQTRVDTVLRYYDAFMARFPDPHALARAKEDDVLAAWSGLGYYRRARLLHAGVREVVARYGGDVPPGAVARRALPGVGRYTAGAIGSMAFGQPEPLVDGNVMRVFARLFRITTPLGQRATEQRMWALAERLVPGPRPGDFNQALMELGALVCHKAAPACESCPVRRTCAARAEGLQAELPARQAKAAPRAVSLVGVVVTRARGREVWLQRGAGTLFGGLWNLPTAEGEGLSTARAALAALGLVGRLAREPVATFEHVLSHRRLGVTLYRGSARPRGSGGDALDEGHQLRAVGRAGLAQLGISSLTRKGLRAGGFLDD